MIGVELEAKFVTLAQANIERHRRHWEMLGLPVPTVITGDSRRLGELVRAAAGGSVTSPPYISGGHHADQTGAWNSNPIMGQLPYANRVDDHGTGPVAEKSGKYGATDGQVGNLRMNAGAITSPPFSQPETRDRTPVQAGEVASNMARSYTMDRQAMSPGNLAMLPIGAASALTSPPYMNSVVNPGNVNNAMRDRLDKVHHDADGYSANAENLGNAAPDTYWSACATIYQQLHDLLLPGGVFVCVVKSFVKQGKMVDLPQMTLDLLLSQGWQPVVWIDALLASEGVQGSMLEGVPDYQKSRKSFFRRLAERKGSPKIDAEVVLVMMRC